MDQDKLDQTRLTSPATDTETGNEALPEEQDRAQARAALQSMYARGLLSDAEFNRRLADLKDGTTDSE